MEMGQHIVRHIEGVPILHRRGLIIPRTLAAFPDCCGAGRGLGQVIVPERNWGLRISPACYVHDDDWDTAPPTWEAFRAANSRLLENINALIEHTTYWAVLRVLRRYRAMTYYSAVSEAAAIFWRIKRRQIDNGMWPGMSLPRNVKL
jgi:hypothetical protein